VDAYGKKLVRRGDDSWAWSFRVRGSPLPEASLPEYPFDSTALIKA
jgi:hypothetical protein